MSELSEVSILYGQHVAEIERARDVFTTETRRFVRDLLENIRDEGAARWSTPKVQIKTRDADLETEKSVTSLLNRQKAVASVDLCFKMRVKYLVISEIMFGIEFDTSSSAFAWRIELIPEGKYQWLDEIIWAEWQKSAATLPPGAQHILKEGTVVFVSRCFGPELTSKVALDDLLSVFKFNLNLESVLVSEFAKQLLDDATQ